MATRQGSARNAGSARKRVSRPAGPVLSQTLLRRRWLRAVAWAWGALVMMAHVYNFPNPRIVTDMFPHSIRDVIYHSSMFASFTLLLRFSLISGADIPARGSKAGRNARATGLSAADVTALIVCMGWGALCETLQIGIPGREFHYNELALNMTVPLITVAIVSLATRRS